MEVSPELGVSKQETGGNPVEHFTDKRILACAQALWLDSDDLKVFKGGSVELHNLSKEKANNLLGIDHHGEVVNTGLRFEVTLPDGRKIKSTPHSIALPEVTDLDQNISGQIDVEIGEESFTYRVVVDTINTGDHLTTNITIMPDYRHEGNQGYLDFYEGFALSLESQKSDKITLNK